MKRNTDKIIKSYIKEIKLYLPVYMKNEKRFLSDLQNSLEDYASLYNITNRETIIKNFGEPKELAINYIYGQDSDILYNSILKNRHIRYFILTIVLMLLTITTTIMFFLYSGYNEAKDAYIEREIINIEEEIK